MAKSSESSSDEDDTKLQEAIDPSMFHAAKTTKGTRFSKISYVATYSTAYVVPLPPIILRFLHSRVKYRPSESYLSSSSQNSK